MADEYNLATSWSASGIACPHCNYQISYYDRRKSMYFGCPQCGSFFEKGSNGTNVLRTFYEPDREPPSFPIGTKGIVDGKEYILVGYITKKEEDEEVYWTEYAFYTPGEDWYLMLAEYDGHWMIIRRSESQIYDVKESPDGRQFAYDGGWPYELYLSYVFKVVDAGGEFDWDVLSDEKLVTYEYVNAPNIVVNELRGTIKSWFRARYISPADIMTLFNVKPEMFPPRNNFNPEVFYPRWNPLIKFTGVLVALLLVINLLLFVIKPGREVYTGTFTCEPDTSSWGACKPVITPSFTISGPGPVYIKMRANQIENNWLALPMALVNDQNGKVYEINKTIEYYHGYDDGDSWSEGSPNQKALVSSVPSGNYHLNIYPETESHDALAGLNFDVGVTQNAFLALNFIMVFLAIITYPVIQFCRKYYFENSKWFAKEYGTINKA